MTLSSDNVPTTTVSAFPYTCVTQSPHPSPPTPSRPSSGWPFWSFFGNLVNTGSVVYVKHQNDKRKRPGIQKSGARQHGILLPVYWCFVLWNSSFVQDLRQNTSNGWFKEESSDIGIGVLIVNISSRSQQSFSNMNDSSSIPTSITSSLLKCNLS